MTANIAAGAVFAVTIIVSATISDRVGRRRLVIAGNAFSTVWALVVFQFIGSVGAVGYGLALCVTMLGVGLIYGPVGSFVPELFAARFRYTGAGVAYSLAGILGGSIPPVVATTLSTRFGTESIGVYLAAMGVLSLVCVRLLSESCVWGRRRVSSPAARRTSAGGLARRCRAAPARSGGARSRRRRACARSTSA